MGLLSWIESKYQKKINNTLEKIESISVPQVNKLQSYNLIKYKFHYSNEIEKNISNNFLDHDGYFTKLMVNNKIIGYIFRCTYRDVELVTKTGKRRLIPYLVTCVYQPAFSFVKSKHIKTLGKDTALKSGIREIKEYINGTNDLELLGLENQFFNIDTIFPTYKDLHAKAVTDDNQEFYNLNEEEYNNILNYIKAFDEKTFKYYSNVSKNDILKIWIKR